MFINEQIELSLKLNIGALINKVNVSIIAYADDLSLIQCDTHFQLMLDEWSNYRSNYLSPFNFLNSNDSQCLLMREFLMIHNASVYCNEINFLFFHKYNQIDLKCLKFPTNQQIEITFKFQFYAERKLILDNSLYLDFKSIHNDYYVYFSNIKGLDSNLNIFKQKVFILAFYFSSFKIYTKSYPMKECKNQNFTLFKNITSLYFTNTVKYYKNTCPYIFKDAVMDYLLFYGIANVFIFKNHLSFLEINEDLNAKIERVSVLTFKSSLDESFFSYELFRKTEMFIFSGVLNKIDPFSISFLSKFTLNLHNLDNFVENNQFLFDTLNSISNKTFFFYFNSNFYYTDEKFCLYKSLRSYERIKYSLDVPIVCTCTFIWIVGDLKGSEQCPQKFSKCNFQEFIKRCNVSNYKYIEKPVSNFYTMLESGIIENFTIFFISPFICFIGTITNLLNWYIIRKIKLEFKEQLYILMDINTKVCLAYFFINIFHMINFCFLPNGDYCLNISKHLIVQYIEIIFYDVLCSILKTLSNVLIVLIAITRLNILKYGSNYKLLKGKIKWFILSVAFILCILNLEKMFNSYVNKYYFPFIEFDYLGYPIKNSFKSWEYLSEPLNIQQTINHNPNVYLLTFFAINYLINTLLIYSLTCIADGMLLLRFRQDLNSVLTMYITSNRANLNDKKIQKFENSRLKTTYFVFFNLFILLIIRSFELGFNTYAVYLKILRTECMIHVKYCSVYIEIGNLFYLLSCSYTIVMYYFLNKNFAETLNNYFSKLRKKIKAQGKN
ncbi:unnamed protein product [Brachionus calyciflorus]|uniref:Uncharacterized protein n=1 Tax=Brachionus calyciflorus TaxID=104777 RepID=A0A814L013_9BILA|nr:unnamed protein product [Brachionus calyciflorus]